MSREDSKFNQIQNKSTQQNKWEEWSNEVLKQLINLNNKCDNLDKDVDGLEEKLESIDKSLQNKIENTQEIVSGNGEPEKGLILRVAVLEKENKNILEALEKIRLEMKEEKDEKKKIFYSIVGVLLTSILSLGIFIFKFFVLKQTD